MQRKLAWFSCGAASAVAAKLAVEKYGDDVEVLYCDTLAYEHPDNMRFMSEVSQWINKPIRVLKSDKYKDIYDVFDRTGWLIGVGGARCTTELKKNVRRSYERPDDVHIFGFTLEEKNRIERFHAENPELYSEFILHDNKVSKQDCFTQLNKAGIQLPAMYRLGYKNNNCIGCVKGAAGYWNKIRVDFPAQFKKMAEQERKMDVAINKKDVDGKRVRIFLDELPLDMGRYKQELDIECGVLCIHEEGGGL